MYLAGTEYSLNTRAFDIFLSGCTRNCPGCFNKEEQNFTYGDKLTIDKIEHLCAKIEYHTEVIDKIRLMGGDPLCQDINELQYFIGTLLHFKKIMVLYTGAEKDEIPGWCFSIFDEIKYGKFILEKQCNGLLYGSTNQHYIIKTGGWKKIV
jgi:anaerobic ribonucleoside-triphosphate reductase activating protein